MKGSRHSHFFLREINDPMLFQFFGTLSDYCWRRTASQVPAGTCFCQLDSHSLSQSRSSPELVSKSIIQFFQVESIQPPATHVKIGIISRRVKRFLLNEYELVDIAQDMGFECVLLPLERMTIYEQMREFRSLDVLVGIHGSGLDNVIFLHPGSVLLQLMPYKNEHRASFVTSTHRAKVVYKEWQATDPSLSSFHWDLYELANKEKLQRSSPLLPISSFLGRMGKNAILAGGSEMGDHRETLMFWINQVSPFPYASFPTSHEQDIIVPAEEWKKTLAECVRASNARSRGLQVD